MGIQLFFFSLIILGSVSSSLSYAKDYSCRTALEDGAELSVTETFISYLKALHEDRLLSYQDLVQFSHTIEATRQMPHPFANIKNKSSEHDLHGPALEDYVVNQNSMNLDQILNWTRGFTGVAQKAAEQKSGSLKKTASSYKKMKFFRIEKSKNKTIVEEDKFTQILTRVKKLFEKKDNNAAPIDRELDHSIEMMNTLVTQAMWVEVMGEMPKIPEQNKTYGQINDIETAIVVDGRRYHLWPDDPVTDITWWSAIEFANRLSLKKGLTPVYDTSEVVFDEEAFLQRGFLVPVKDKKNLARLKINEKANGYRLPTKEEIYFAATNRGRDTDLCPDENIQWSKDNYKKNFLNHSTALFPPLMVEGNPFYDLHNGLSEWLNDQVDIRGTKQYQEMDRDKLAKFYRLTRYKTHMHASSENVRHPVFSAHSTTGISYSLGFRLVRTVE